MIRGKKDGQGPDGPDFSKKAVSRSNVQRNAFSPYRMPKTTITLTFDETGPSRGLCWQELDAFKSGRPRCALARFGKIVKRSRKLTHQGCVK